jgi:hypothetical protein
MMEVIMKTVNKLQNSPPYPSPVPNGVGPVPSWGGGEPAQGQGWPSAPPDTRGQPQGASPYPGEPGNAPLDPQQSAGGPATPAAGHLSSEEKAALQSALAVIKESREAVAEDQFTGVNGYRFLAAYAYLLGFLEAKGIGEVGAFVKTIPPATSSDEEDGQQYDKLIESVEAMLKEEQGTRFLPIVAAVGGMAVRAAAQELVWRGVKRVMKKK